MPTPGSSNHPPRIRIQDVTPVLDCGRYPVKRTVGETVEVEATIFRDGHDTVAGRIRYRGPGQRRWASAPLEALGNDRFAGSFEVTALGRWQYTVEAWTDRAETWRDELRRRVAGGQADLSSELLEGEALLGISPLDVETALASTVADTYGPVQLDRPLEVEVDRERARFGAWYELFPRSFGGFAGVEKALPKLADLGFDVVYFPPIHPIGRTGRKGRNNTLPARTNDPGSPWAIGGPEGGHTAVHPELGTLADFDRLVERAAGLGLEIALDLAIQCSPDHPWLTEHPGWFRHRPDGTIKYAENPPKRYQDIVNVDFDCEDWRGLWDALLDVFRFWAGHGVRIFRVDNPHTKPLAFWEWLIGNVHDMHPDTVFLAEAFTRPAMMHALGKAGFDQSYTYFTWRNARWELEQYVDELAYETAEYFRPNFFVNTPDILHAYLQDGGPPAFEVRLVLAATLSPSYGIYSGFERFENVPLHEGSEEYLGSEKYELKKRRLDGPLLPLVRRLNRIRRAHPAFQHIDDVTFLATENEELIAYAKVLGDDALVVVVNLDPLASREGLAIVPESLGFGPVFPVEDLLTGESYEWETGRNYVQLRPGGAHVMHVLELPEPEPEPEPEPDDEDEEPAP
jgi:starch synthase (maltosyl-transferring)